MLLTDIWKVPTWLSLLVIILRPRGSHRAVVLHHARHAAQGARRRHGNDQPGRSSPTTRRCSSASRATRTCDSATSPLPWGSPSGPCRRSSTTSSPRDTSIAPGSGGETTTPSTPTSPCATGCRGPRRRHAPDAPAVGAPGTRACGLPCPTMRHVPHTRTSHRRTLCTLATPPGSRTRRGRAHLLWSTVAALAALAALIVVSASASAGRPPRLCPPPPSGTESSSASTARSPRASPSPPSSSRSMADPRCRRASW